MDEAFRPNFERYVRELEALGHRGSASANERRAAEYLEAEQRALGLSPTLEGFRGCTSLGGRLLVHVLVGLVAAALLWFAPVGTIALGSFALVSLFLDGDTRWPLLGRLLIRHPSQNVVARVPAASGEARRRVVVLGHYDTQRTGLIWSDALSGNVGPMLSRLPGVMRSPLFPVQLAMLAAVVLGGIALAWPGSAAVTWGGLLVCGVLGIAAVLLGEWARGSCVPGANDNATGAAAVLTLAAAYAPHPASHTEVVFLCTGCEETGLLGAGAWAEAHRDEVRALPTVFLNLDTLGHGGPRFLGGELSLAGVPARYPARLIDLCGEAAAELGFVDAGPHEMPVPSDGLALLVRGIPGVSILGFGKDGYLPNYHQLSDTSDRMDFDVAWRGVQLGWAVLSRLSARD